MTGEPAMSCPECSALWTDGRTCTDDFHQMLFWETERPSLGEVHHLMVLCYHLQHPSLYSQETFRQAQTMLRGFMDGTTTPRQFRQQNRTRLSSTNRTWKITGTPGSQGAYDHPVNWKMRSGDVVAAGIDSYTDSIRRWARSILDELESGR